MSGTPATRHVGNASTGPIFIDGHGLLLPDDERDTPDLVEVPESDQVRELLGYGALWTHQQETPASSGETNTPKKAAKPAGKD